MGHGPCPSSKPRPRALFSQGPFSLRKGTIYLQKGPICLQKGPCVLKRAIFVSKIALQKSSFRTRGLFMGSRGPFRLPKSCCLSQKNISRIFIGTLFRFRGPLELQSSGDKAEALIPSPWSISWIRIYAKTLKPG